MLTPDYIEWLQYIDNVNKSYDLYLENNPVDTKLCVPHTYVEFLDKLVNDKEFKEKWLIV